MFSLNFLVPHAMICITILTFPILVPFLDWVLAGGKLGPWLLFWGLVPLSSLPFSLFPLIKHCSFPTENVFTEQSGQDYGLAAGIPRQRGIAWS